LDRLKLQYTSYTTSGPKDAGRIGQEIAKKHQDEEEPIKVIVAGGDGTAHELIEGIVGMPGQPAANRIWQLIILPLGTVSPSPISQSLNGPRQMLYMPHYPPKRPMTSRRI
jgi:diacylglycerol kinase family enzyme